MATPKRSTNKAAGTATAKATDRTPQLQRRLAKAIPEPECEIDHGSPWQLLIGTILSAQSTDKRVNMTTPDLFAAYPTPAALGAAEQDDVERLVKSTGFFRNKAKSIRATSKQIADEHGGEVPRDMDALLALPGVARKTANLVLGTAYGISSGIIVDTHARRVSQRLGFTVEEDPLKIERDLCALFAKKDWVTTGHRLVLHGRYVCTAKKPSCARCALNELCDVKEAEPEGAWTKRALWEADFVASRGTVDPSGDA
jgi:endonuclease-3